MKTQYLLSLGLFFSPFAIAQSCPDNGIYLQALGSGGPELSDNAASTSYAIWQNGKIRVLVDTGSGSAENFGKTQQAFSAVEAILFSHFHTDHSADFATYIKNSFFEQRQQDLFVYGPTGNRLLPGTQTFIQRFIGKEGVYPYLSSYLTGNGSYTIHTQEATPSATPQSFTRSGMTFTATDAEHGPFPALAWRVDIAGKSMTFSGDNSGQSSNLVELAKDSDWLVMHNAVPDSITGVAKNLHMTPQRIGEISAAAKAKKVLLSHFMNRSKDNQKQTESAVKRSFNGTLAFAQDLRCYAL